MKWKGLRNRPPLPFGANGVVCAKGVELCPRGGATESWRDDARVSPPFATIRHRQSEKAVGRCPAPRDFKIRKIITVKLVQWGIFCAAEVAAVSWQRRKWGRSTCS